jgi:hypothetical protein
MNYNALMVVYYTIPAFKCQHSHTVTYRSVLDMFLPSATIYKSRNFQNNKLFVIFDNLILIKCLKLQEEKQI